MPSGYSKGKEGTMLTELTNLCPYQGEIVADPESSVGCYHSVLSCSEHKIDKGHLAKLKIALQVMGTCKGREL